MMKQKKRVDGNETQIGSSPHQNIHSIVLAFIIIFIWDRLMCL